MYSNLVKSEVLRHLLHCCRWYNMQGLLTRWVPCLYFYRFNLQRHQYICGSSGSSWIPRNQVDRQEGVHRNQVGWGSANPGVFFLLFRGKENSISPIFLPYFFFQIKEGAIAQKILGGQRPLCPPPPPLNSPLEIEGENPPNIERLVKLVTAREDMSGLSGPPAVWFFSVDFPYAFFFVSKSLLMVIICPRGFVQFSWHYMSKK